MSLPPYWMRLLVWWCTRKHEEWRIVYSEKDDKWYVQQDHADYGWVTFMESASEKRRDAVIWAHRRYEKPERTE